MFACFKRKLYSDIRVAQLAGYVSENAAYHHGEASLQGQLLELAQNYVGSNNINLLEPNGQFGTRIMGGGDAASSRYIHTELNKLSTFIYPKEDFPILEYVEDDGLCVEPYYYVPIIPMVLVNGMTGIGTGSVQISLVSIQKYICKNIRNILNNNDFETMEPWFKNFKGQLLKLEIKLTYVKEVIKY